ncbi:MAG: hypothetical protein WC100_06950 [Sterolibacterium sp.]
MRLKSFYTFECFPDGSTPVKVDAGMEFEIEDRDYAMLLISKGHAKEIAEKIPQKTGAVYENLIDQAEQQSD